jgi:hypothetical protein
MADNFLRSTAKAANILATVKSGELFQLACFVVGVLTDRKPEIGGDTIVTDRPGRLPKDEIPHIV